MTATMLVALFFFTDLALVVGGLLWLSRRRAQADITDMRFRDRHRRRYF